MAIPYRMKMKTTATKRRMAAIPTTKIRSAKSSGEYNLPTV